MPARPPGGPDCHWPGRFAGGRAPPFVDPWPDYTPPATGPSREAYRAYYADCVASWSGERYALDKRFVQLTLLLDQGPGTPGPRWQSISQPFDALDKVLQHVPDAPAIVVLGPPGAGKSTLLRHYELGIARTILAASGEVSQAPLTFFLSLHDYKPTQMPLDWLATRWAATHPMLPALHRLLQERRVTLLLDALNEMPAASAGAVALWRMFLRELTQDYPGNRVIFSCRSLDYSTTLSSQEVPVPQVRIEPLTGAQVEAFLRLYCPEHGAALWRNLHGTPQLELFRSPYYLKLLVQQSTDGHIPRGHVALFTGFVWQALQREVESQHPLFSPDMLTDHDRRRLIKYDQKPPPVLPERGVLIPSLSKLAWQMQQRRGGQEATQVQITYDEALEILDSPHAADILEAGAALALLDQDLREDKVLYVHQLLQEYFAARYLARAPQPTLVQQVWRAAEAEPPLATTVATLGDSDPLPLLPSTGWEKTTELAAAMARHADAFVTDLMNVNLPLAGRCAAQPDVQVSERVRDHIRWALVQRTQDPEADLRGRIAAGLALGTLGDPRFTRRAGLWGPYLLPPLIAIPGGSYQIGVDEERQVAVRVVPALLTRSLQAAATPVHSVVVASFAIAQFPVTNAEWALFMHAGGYEDERWWDTDAAQMWWRGQWTAEAARQQFWEKRTCLQAHVGSMQQWCQQGAITSTQAEEWATFAHMRDDEFHAVLDGLFPPGRQAQPGSWQDEAFNNPAQPVVGLCWFEARAYCAWLSAQTRQRFRLPTEAEWEAAARGGSQCSYVCGDTFDATRCNTFETHIRRPTPVGVFPAGQTPAGVMDMAGNIWEWTSSQVKEYPYDATDGRESLVSPGKWCMLVARGGSWYHRKPYVYTSFRLERDPGLRRYDLGLRVALST
ncbi:MAG TPA: SUMF1/EgtB/PvdO family nonheme iron enzyme [Candidatus Tectomicrobia bacterium]